MLKIKFVDAQLEEQKDADVEIKLIKLPAGFGCDAFFIAETPITEAQWCTVMGEKVENPNFPKVNVSFIEALDFCKKASNGNFTFRLPTELQWCRALGIEPECLEKYAVFGYDALCEVKTKTPNEFGLYDMRGLVWEWLDSETNIQDTKIMRGGSWFNYNVSARAVNRYDLSPGVRDYCSGFRLAVA